MTSIGQTLAEIWRFNGFPNGSRRSPCIFNFESLTASTVQRGSMRHGDQSNRCRDMTTF